MKKNFIFKRVLTLVLAVMMLVTAMPVGVLAETGTAGAEESKYLADDYSITYKVKINDEIKDKIIRKADYINKVDNLPIKPIKTENAETLVKNPKQPDRYTVRADFKVERGDDYVISYQPYIATVGAAASDEEKKKVNKELNFPVFDGYTSATKKTTVDYKFVKERADKGKEKKDPDLGVEKKGPYEAIYKPIESSVLVKHVFQSFDKPEVYGEKLDDPKDYFRETTQTGLTGTSLKIQPLPDNEIEGYVPESNDIKTQVPENPKGFVVEFRYNRASYDLIYDTDGGTPIPSRRVYYKQVIPKLSGNEIPSKEGCDFLGWKPSHDIEDKNGKKFKAGEIIAVGTGQAIKNLDANLLVPALKAKNNNRPAEKLIFTAVWKDKEKADYAVQFWAEKADHDDNATTAQKYEYMGTRVYKDVNTGTRPDLATEPVKDIVFPDLDQARLKKIWANVRFNRGRDLYLNKFFVYNQALTADQNKDPKKVNLVKAVNANGKTVYNIYYDRQVYDLYFTKSNALPAENTFYPEIWGYDEAKGEVVQKGGPGNPYHYKARFNQLMLGWPNDAMQTKGFSEGMQSFGWGPNYNSPNFPTHLDTPPYRLNADEFLDMENYDKWGGYTKKIDKGDGTSIDFKWSDYTTLSFGIKQAEGSMPHHMDFWMDGFKTNETIIRYDLYRYKADTNSETYAPSYPKVQGFTGKDTNETPDYLNSDDIDAKNDEREDVTPFPTKTYTDMYGERPVGKMQFIKAFFNNSDDWGDPDGWDGFDTNGYLKFEYYRNKYPLRFNYDPSKIKGDDEFGKTNSLNTFYEFPLKALSPDLVDNKTPQAEREYFKNNPANLLDDPNNLYKLGLYDLLQRDKDDPNKFATETIKIKDKTTGEDKDYTTYKVKRPESLSPQMVFKGWALDPAGSKLVLGSKGETMPSHPVNLYAKWGEPDYKWKITFDPNGGKMPDLKPKTITSEEKTIREGDIGFEREVTYPLAGYKNQDGTEIKPTVDGKKIFTVIQRQKLVPPEIPTRKGYEFMGWELVRYKKDDKGNLKLDQNKNPIEDTLYRDEFDVPELYSFDNDVVSDLYLRAIWNKNDLIDIKVYHHFLDKDYKEESMQEQVLQNRRVGSYVGAVGSRQDASRILVPKDEWDILAEKNKTDKAGSMTYSDYVRFDPVNPRVNSYYQQIIVKPLKIIKEDNELIDNPEAKYNVFHYYYRPFRKREYKVNYLDVRAKDKIETIFEIRALNKEIPKLEIQIKRASNKAEKKKLEDIKEKKEKRLEELEKKSTEGLVTLSKKYAIIDQETVTNGNRDFDARNYRHIPGWVLADGEKPQQQLFFDVNEETNELLGINGTESDEIYFFYQDVRVIESKKDDPVPNGYVRITYKIDDENKGGTFIDKGGKKVTELYYDVIKGLRSDNLDAITPKVWVDGELNLDGTEKQKEEGKYYITPDNGKNFIKWDKSQLLNKDTVIEQNYTFTAYFNWSGAAANPMVVTEAFKDENADGTKDWSNKFAPTIEQLKKQIVWKAEDKTTGKIEDKPLPQGSNVEIVKEDGTTPLTDKDVYDLVNEKKAADKDELVRTVNVKAKVTFKDGKEPQELTIPITVYKNVYEALTGTEKPLFLSQAEKGELKDITGDYVKVTVNPTGKPGEKDSKIYYVNPKAWVEIPEIKLTDEEKKELGFTNWTADKNAQNENKEANGVYEFTKRHKFTENTIISPGFAKDVVEQTDPNKKPDVPKTFVKVIVKTTDKATAETAFEKTFWVNPTKEVTIPVTNPTGKTVEADPTKPGTLGYTMNFDKWTSNETTPRTWEDKIVGKFEKETTIEAKYSINFENIKDIAPKTDTVHTAKGKIPTEDEIKAKMKAPEGKTISKVTIVEEPNVNKEGPAKVKVKVEYTDGSSVGTDTDPIEIPVEVHKNIIPEAPGGERPKDALDNYVKVILKAGEGGKFENTLTNEFVYYVSPDVEADMTEEAEKIKKIPDTGYIVNGGTWTPEIKSEKIEAEKTYIFNFKKSIDIVEKTEPNQKAPDGYVTVTFKAEENGKYGKLEGDIVEKVYYVNPKAGIKLGKTAAAKVIQVPKATPAANYVFDKWFEAIDEDTPITSDRIHVAKFKSDKVTLIYEAGEGTGTAPISAIVDYGTSVRLASPDGLTKADAKFLGWKLDGDTKTYKPGELVKLEKSRTATAQWESDKPIIEYTQDNPKTRPDGYVRVSFVADNGLKLENVKYYYVKKNAKDEHGNAITLEKLTKPTVTPETGYKSTGWDKADSVEIKDKDITVKALSEGLKDAIEKTPQVTKAPDGYVTVKFVAGPHGTVDEKTYFVNPNKYVSLTPPTATGDTGYEFNTWSSNKMGDFSLTNYIRYTENTDIVAKFNQKDSVFPKKDGFTPPANYVEVNFEVDPACRTCGKLEGITTYYVDPNREVSIPKPNTVAGTGYIFDKWIVKTGPNKSDDFKPAENHQYKEAQTTIYVSFKKLDDIVPLEKNQTEINLQPEGYVKVVFMKGSHANKMEGNSVYYVNPKANKTMGDQAIIRPTITPDVGWKQKSDDEAWKILDTIAVTNNTAITEDLYIIAQYTAIPDYIEKTDPNQTAPNGYVEVKFIPGKNGKLKDSSGTVITEKVYFVNPSKYVVLPEPDVDPNQRYEFVSWDQDNGSYTKGYTQYTENTVIKARFNPARKVIPANTIPSKPANYVEVKFALEKVDANEAGTFKEREVLSYYVEKNVTVKINPPEIDINPGYKFDKWIIKDNQSEQEIKPQNDNTYADDITIYGKFDTFPDVIPSKTPIGDVNPKPQGYVTVTFDKGENGVLDGQTVFYVKPNAGIKLGNSIIEKPNVFAANSYSFSGWDVTGDDTAEDKSTIDNFLIKDANITVKAIYTKMPPIIKAGPEQTAPAGYVVIIFKTDGKGKLLDNAVENNSTINPESKDQESEIVYFVDPNRKLSADHDVRLVKEDVPVSYKALPIPSPVPNDNKRTKFDRWVEDINYTDPIKRGRVYVATFKPNEVSLTYEANGATGDVPAVTTVDYGKKLRLAGPGNLKKDNASFAGWMIDGIGLKQVGDEITLEESKTAIAQWNDDEQIIEYDPINKPMTRPDDTYLKVSFTSDDGITLNETKAYYVKKNTKLSDLTMPKYSVNTGYTFDKWFPDDVTEITQDITFKATSTTIADTIDKSTNPNKPSGYVEVTFKADGSRNGTVEEKTYFVNPNKYVTLTPPTAKGNTGYEFGAWSDDATKPTVYTGKKTITAKFNPLGDKIDKDNKEERKKPDGYKTVEFVVDDNGSILNGENTVYYVKPGAYVTIEPPKTSPKIGYEPVKWDKDTTVATEYTEETTIIKGTFKPINDIVEAKKEDGTVNPKPDGYVTVTFISGKNGTLYYGNASAPNTMDKKVYYVNPKTNNKLKDLTKPKVKPDTGFEQKEESGKFVWDILGDTLYQDELVIDKDMIINAEYTPLDDVVPKEKATGGENTKPDGYIVVTFKTTDKAGNVEKTVYVNPNKAVKLEDKAPAVTPGLGYEFAGWNRPIKETILYKDKDVITAQFNEFGNVIPQEKTDGTDKPAGYVTVTFDKGTNGKELTGKTVYYVKPNTEVTVTAPKVTAQTGYRFKTWDNELKQTFKNDTKITAQFNEIGNVIPQENPDGSDKPDGYVKVTFDKGDHGNLKEEKVYYVNPTKEVTLQAPEIIADLGYKFANWDQELKQTFANDTTIKAKYDKLDPVVPEYSSTGSKNDKPSGYVEVKLIPTANATDETKEDKIYFVNPSVPVTITRAPKGKEEEVNKITYSYTFAGWRVIRGTINSWDSSKITGQFIQDTDIEAIYSVELLNIMPLPLAKDNLVTAKGEVPNAPDLIKNIPGSQDKPLPDGTTIQYAPNGKPKVDEAGNTSAELLIKYPNGSTTTLTVPITVVDNVVEQFGNDKPLVPETYVEVIVDTTDKAKENTYYVKTFWVKPDTTVTLPVLAPTGKVIVDDNGVRQTNHFKYWSSDNDKKTKYDGKIGKIIDSFSSTRLKTTITAVYKFEDNKKAEPNNGIKLAQNSTPSAKDFINNVYNDSDPNNPKNLPPGTRFEFAYGNPDTSTEGKDKLTTIKVTYPNGEVKEVNVKYNVSGDVVEQTDPNYKPNYIPDDYIQVIVTTKETIEKVSVPADPMPQPPSTEEVERADEYTRFTRTFWVKPGVEVTLPVKGSKIVGLTDEEDHRQWIFDHWQETGYDTSYGSDDIIGVFYEREKNKPIYIEAKYRKDDVPVPSAEYVVTEVGVYPSEQQYRDVITAPKGKAIDKTEVLSRPDVSRPGLTKATIRVTYTDGTQAEVVVMVYVKERNDPRPSEPQIIYRDRIVEKEKIVEKIVKIKDNERLKELRYMQGFNGKFRPYDGLRRSEAAQILANALKADGYAYDPFYPISYTDIGDTWYTEAVRIVSQAGVFQGYSDGTFKPEGKITRAEWVATLRRFQDLKKVSGNDMGLSMGHWATEEIEAAYQAGWLDVYTSGIAYFDANAPITRQEVAAVSNKAFDRVLDKAYLKRNVNNMIHYKDINPSMPLYEDILCASNTLLTDGRYYKANAIDMDTLTFNIITDDLLIYQKKFQFISH